MSPLAGNRPKPFKTEVNERLEKGDIKNSIVLQLEHELDGLIPPYGALSKKLIFAEIGIILPENIVWICIPNKKYITKEKYQKAFDGALKGEGRQKFTYNGLIRSIQTSKTDSDELKKLIESHFITVVKGSSQCKIGCSDACLYKEKIHSGNVSCDAITKIANSTQEEFCHWFDYVIKNFSDVKQNIVPMAHTFFPIVRPGSYFHSNDIRMFQNNIIGGALFYWDKVPPAPSEILYLRRIIMNTLWAELGPRLRLLKLSGVSAREIPMLIALSCEGKPFLRPDHDDTTPHLTRKNICNIINSSVKCAKNCSVAIEAKSYIYDETQECISKNDFCGTLEEYKGMFELFPTLYCTDNDPIRRRFEVNPNRDTLLFRLLSFLDLEIDYVKGVADPSDGKNKICLPYNPSWLFLVTIKLLSLTLRDNNKSTKISLFKEEECWVMTVYFPRKEGVVGTEGVTNLKNAIDEEGTWRGDKSTAIRDVLFGKLGALGDDMLVWYPEERIVKIICEMGHKGPLMKYTLSFCEKTDQMVLALRWPK